MHVQEEDLWFLAIPPRLGMSQEMQRRNADLAEHGVFQRVALGLTRPLFVEGIAVDFDDDLRLLDLAGTFQ